MFEKDLAQILSFTKGYVYPAGILSTIFVFHEVEDIIYSRFSLDVGYKSNKRRSYEWEAFILFLVNISCINLCYDC